MCIEYCNVIVLALAITCPIFMFCTVLFAVKWSDLDLEIGLLKAKIFALQAEAIMNKLHKGK